MKQYIDKWLLLIKHLETKDKNNYIIILIINYE